MGVSSWIVSAWEVVRRYQGPAGVALIIATSLVAVAAATWHIVIVPGVATVSRIAYLFFFLCLFYCAFAYQVNRFGAALRRLLPSPRRGGEGRLLGPEAPAVTILVPTYREERRVLQMTVLSAALARYGRRNVVVLVDDPPTSSSRPETLAAVEELRARLAEPMDKLRAEADAADARSHTGFVPSSEAARLAELYSFAADWLDDLRVDLRREISIEFAHVDGFFIDDVVGGLAYTYRRRAAAIAKAVLSRESLLAEYERLAVLFCDDVAVFERKQFANLSHAANKAMNLNSYMGLVGGRYDVVQRPDGWHLVPDPSPDAPFEVPTADYLLTLDADSVIRSTYLLDLVEVAEANPRAGVVQTPYLTFPGATSPVERVAGATTDIQYLVHQGSSLFGAAHWVGANALLRKHALDDIRVDLHDGKALRPIFVQDQTVIEDTGSTVDLLTRGWVVHNHFKPLAFSATPADFGSLAIQRQRWSNGGLIIFPSLWRQHWRSARPVAGLVGFLLRTHYLLSPLIGNLAVLMLMVLLLGDSRQLLVASLAMVPYFLLYGLDLARIGYRFRDLFAVCSLNLMLLPVSLAGVVASVMQLLTGRKAAFARTPKIAGRTAVHPVYILFNLGIFALMLHYAIAGLRAGDYIATIVPAANVLLYGYGLYRFIGIWNAIVDLARPLGDALAALFPARPRRFSPLRLARGMLAWLVALTAILVPASLNNASLAGGGATAPAAVPAHDQAVPVSVPIIIRPPARQATDLQ